MGKKGRWLSAIKKAFTGSSKEAPDPPQGLETNVRRVKKRWVFGMSKHGQISSLIHGEPSSIEKILEDADSEWRRQRVQTVIKLDHARVSAIRIQAAYRGYRARRRYKALRGLMRLQRVVRGQEVKRQMANTMRHMQRLVRVQSQVHAWRSRMAESRRLRLLHAAPPRNDEERNLPRQVISVLKIEFCARFSLGFLIPKSQMHVPGGSRRRPWRMGRQLAGERAAGGEDAKEGGGCHQEGKSAGLRLLPPSAEADSRVDRGHADCGGAVVAYVARPTSSTALRATGSGSTAAAAPLTAEAGGGGRGQPHELPALRRPKLHGSDCVGQGQGEGDPEPAARAQEEEVLVWAEPEHQLSVRRQGSSRRRRRRRWNREDRRKAAEAQADALRGQREHGLRHVDACGSCDKVKQGRLRQVDLLAA